jgi:inosine-uridine nucleoside N-ribohydrolase
LPQVIDNTARVLSLAGAGDVTLIAGAVEPLRRHKAFCDSVLKRQASSGNGVCNIDYPPAANPLPTPQSPDALAAQLVALAERHGKLSYVILGPATNFAQICAVLGDRIDEVIENVTMMGGRFDALWAENPVADFNVLCDPDAVRVILECGLKPRFVPLNTTWPIALPLAAVEALRAVTMLGTAAQELMIAHCRHFAPEPIFRFHDPAAVMTLCNPLAFEDVKIDIITDDTSADFGRLILGAGFDAQLHRADDAARDAILTLVLKGLGLIQSQSSQ